MKMARAWNRGGRVAANVADVPRCGRTTPVSEARRTFAMNVSKTSGQFAYTGATRDSNASDQTVCSWYPPWRRPFNSTENEYVPSEFLNQSCRRGNKSMQWT